MTAWVHVITPGDHFSPLTGSAIPTVVDGLARASLGDGARPHRVLVERGTFAPRYDSAEVEEYAPLSRPSHAVSSSDRLTGFVLGTRPREQFAMRRVGASQNSWEPSVVLAHNLVQLVPSINTERHRPVLYAHNQLLRYYTKRASGRVLKDVVAIVCVSQFLADQTAARLPQSLQGAVSAVGNGVDCGQFYPREGKPDGEGLLVGFVGRTIPDKGPDVLVSAVALLGRKDIRAVIVGNAGFDAEARPSTYEIDMRKCVRQADVNVDFIPFVNRLQLPDLLRTFDVLVVPSRWEEPWSLAVVEGLASGLPVVASDIGGIPEAAGGAALLVPPGDTRALANALEWLATDPAARGRIGHGARRHALDHDWAWTWHNLRTVQEGW